jgi:4-hydroxythreonine-4-phosphate dehydrogenase
MLIGITMGDANGVGPELILKAYSAGELSGDFIVIGDYAVLQYCNALLGYKVPLKKVQAINDRKEGFLNVLDLGLLQSGQIQIGTISKEAGMAAVQYVECATQMALDGQISALVTLPMNKEAARLSNENFTGHTELIAGMCGQSNNTMMLASDKLTVTHVSTHVSMEEAIRLIRRERVYNVIKLTSDALKRFHPRPRIAVAGLNPHAGENGSFGMEEINEIRPAVMQAKREGLCVEGPIPPDTVFYRACKKEFDAVVCMYHDQGHIPMKVLDFEGGVNVTLGLKVIRTSVDHGTAFDIAYKGIASTRSFIAAYAYAAKMVGSVT